MTQTLFLHGDAANIYLCRCVVTLNFCKQKLSFAQLSNTTTTTFDIIHHLYAGTAPVHLTCLSYARFSTYQLSLALPSSTQHLQARLHTCNPALPSSTQHLQTRLDSTPAIQHFQARLSTCKLDSTRLHTCKPALPSSTQHLQARLDSTPHLQSSTSKLDSTSTFTPDSVPLRFNHHLYLTYNNTLNHGSSWNSFRAEA